MAASYQCNCKYWLQGRDLHPVSVALANFPINTTAAITAYCNFSAFGVSLDMFLQDLADFVQQVKIMHEKYLA